MSGDHAEDQVNVGEQQAAQAGNAITLAQAVKIVQQQQASGPRPFSNLRPGTKIESIGVLMEGRYVPPIDLHPGVIEGLENYKEFEGYLAPAKNAFSTAYESLKQIDEARQAAAKNRARTPEQVVLITAQFAEKKQDAITRVFDKARSDLMAAAKTLNSSLTTPLEQQAVAGTTNWEIRAHVKNLTTEQRMKFMTDAINSGRSKVLTAVLGAESFLSGLTDGIHASFTRLYWEKSSPEVVRRLNATSKAIDLIEQRAGSVLVQVEKAMGGTWKEVKVLRGMATEEEKAFLR